MFNRVFAFTTVLVFVFMLLASRLKAQSVVSEDDRLAALQQEIPALMQKGDIPGLSIAVIHNGRLVWTQAYGIMNAETGKPVTPNTVFEAASLSKCVFAYGVLKLVDEGKLDLDTPLTHYLGNNYGVPDPRIDLITARHVLSHSAGFPNWRENDHTDTLQIHFPPGTKWSYSGEGIVYLSKVVEKITGLSLEDFMQQTVLKPLGMRASSYTWQVRFDSTKAYRHDGLGKLTGRNQKETGGLKAITEESNAAASLTTNAADYAKFILALLNGKGLKKTTWAQMTTPQIRVTDKYPALAWGLGIGLETLPDGTWCWHWGDNGDAKAFFMANLATKNAVVYFADGSGGLSIANEILGDAVGGEHPSLKNLGYERYNAPSRLLLKAILSDGAAKSLTDYRKEREKDSARQIPEAAMNSLGYTLIQLKKLDAAEAIFLQNTVDFPRSWNVWDSYAEVFMDKGDTANAILYYKRSIELNPDNTNGKAQLKKLQAGPPN
jgi:CubicO group peptidase (beta-lactamase class C family)